MRDEVNREKERTLTPAEERRKARTEQTKASFREKGYNDRELTMGIVRANVLAVALCVPLSVPFVVWFILRNGFGFDRSAGIAAPILTWAAILISLLVHELIHALVWSLFSEKHGRAVELGFIKEYLTPYCACLEPLRRGQYMAGSVMPGLALGIVPMLIAVLTANVWLMIYGIIEVMGAGGDFLITLKLAFCRTDAKDVWCLDHPTALGLILLEKS